MRFIPNYTVSYKGAFHQAGKPFEIDPKDREEMERHGTVVEDKPVKPVEPPTAPADAVEVSAPAQTEKPARKGGRPRKAVSE